MDQIKIGNLISRLRRSKGLTQLQLAELIGVTDKAVSKWERGNGAPDIGNLAVLADVFGVSLASLLEGELEENALSNGNMKKIRLYCCTVCGNIITATDQADVECCGKRMEPLKPVKCLPEQALTVEESDGEFFITSEHEMTREHYISFLLLVSDDLMMMKKLYPEWGLAVRFPKTCHGVLYWYCNRDGLKFQYI